LKHEKIDEDFGLLELATNAGRNVKKKTGILYIVHSICNTDGQLGIDRIRLIARMTRLLVGLSEVGIEKIFPGRVPS